MNKHSILFIGLDTHKEFNEVAYIEGSKRSKKGSNLDFKKGSNLDFRYQTLSKFFQL